MNTLTTIEQNTIKNLPVNYQEFVAAKFGTQIKAFNDKDLYNRCVDIITIIMVSAGVKDQADEKVVTFLSNELWKDLSSPKYNHLSINEIEHALKLGVRLEYGQFFGINITTIHSWIKSYLADKTRESALKEFNKLNGGLTEDKFTLANPEGQKKVLEILKSAVKGFEAETKQNIKPKRIIEKSPFDIMVQTYYSEFEQNYKKAGFISGGIRFIKHEGVNYDQTLFVEMRINGGSKD